MIELNNFAFEDLDIGREFQFSRKISLEDLDIFSELTGDFNPLHTDSEFSKKQGFPSKVVHGLLAGSLFSTLVGMVCPGKNNLYLSQTMKFKKPIFPNDNLIIKGTILEKTESLKILLIKTEIMVNGEIKTEGEARVTFLKE